MSHVRPRALRAGFTLIELLVVIAIIAILSGLLLAGVMYATRTTKVVEANNDISQLQVALQQFKSRYGIYPPGIIRLCSRRAQYTMTNDISNLDTYSVSVLNKIWPKLGNFGAAGSPTAATGIRWDGTFGSNQLIDVVLYGDQCLVFFLGGIIPRANVPALGIGSVVTAGLTGLTAFSSAGQGFSTDPTDPSNFGVRDRIGPFYPFQSARLTTAFHGTTAAQHGGLNTHGGHFPAYYDAFATPDTLATNGIGVPYLYFSGTMRNAKNAYYDPLTTPNVAYTFPGKLTINGRAVVTQAIQVTPDINGISGDNYTPETVCPLYISTTPGQAMANPFVNAAVSGQYPLPQITTSPTNATVFPTTCYAPDSFQLICAGQDQIFGPGGQYPSASGSYDMPGYPNNGSPGVFHQPSAVPAGPVVHRRPGSGQDDIYSSNMGVTQ